MKNFLAKQKRKFGMPFRIRSVRKFFVCLTLCTLFLLVVFGYENTWLLQLIRVVTRTSGIKEYKNYFQNASRLQEMGLVVNTSHCQITNFSPWDEEILPLVKAAEPLEDCLTTNYNWSRMDYDWPKFIVAIFASNQVLVMNSDRMEENGYPFENQFCCYKTVTRESGPALVEEKQADNTVSYSTCIRISEERTRIYAEFIMVECSWSRFTKVQYRGFHGVASYHRNERRNVIEEKVIFWETKRASGEEMPPNILVVGIDSTSRINFRRNMLQTLAVLQSLEAVEMFGYTKVGENTFPNYCPMFNGYSEEEIFRLCLPNYMTYQDDCPLIWKQFDAANYLTAQTEDAPEFTGFNYKKAGFAKQPVDFYGRPMFLAAHDYGDPYKLNLIRAEHLDCISYLTNDEAITTYLGSTMDFAHENKAPIFSFSWSTTLAHDNFNMIQVIDETYSEFLKRMIIKGYLNNTILFFMGDHGYRFGPSRETIIGYYEDKLPNLWIRLPPTIQEKFPDWQKSLEINSRRLTSPYHYYWTMNYIMQTFASGSLPPPAKDLKTEEFIERSYHQNFLQRVPESNSCSDVGIPATYCACYPVISLPLTDPHLLESAEKALQKINLDLNLGGENMCAELTVGKITSGAKQEKEDITRYIVSFLAFPGEFLIEAEIDFFAFNKTFSGTPDFLRASKINQNHVKCVTDPKIELFCYCKDAT